jgi:hypothetical protein
MFLTLNQQDLLRDGLLEYLSAIWLRALIKLPSLVAWVLINATVTYLCIPISQGLVCQIAF